MNNLISEVKATNPKLKVLVIYNKVAPNVVAKRTIKNPHHFPKTKPEKISNGEAKPKNNTHTIQNKKNSRDNNKKFSLL